MSTLMSVIGLKSASAGASAEFLGTILAKRAGVLAVVVATSESPH
jgi:hypothetical protein